MKLIGYWDMATSDKFVKNLKSTNNKEDTHRAQDDLKRVDEINKRQLGRLILKHCGNEGTQDDEQSGSMRRLLQEAIDYLPQEKENVWRNADITIYDIKGNVLQIVSGNASNRFIINLDMKGQTRIKKVTINECIVL